MGRQELQAPSRGQDGHPSGKAHRARSGKDFSSHLGMLWHPLSTQLAGRELHGCCGGTRAHGLPLLKTTKPIILVAIKREERQSPLTKSICKSRRQCQWWRKEEQISQSHGSVPACAHTGDELPSSILVMTGGTTNLQDTDEMVQSLWSAFTAPTILLLQRERSGDVGGYRQYKAQGLGAVSK